MLQIEMNLKLWSHSISWVFLFIHLSSSLVAWLCGQVVLGTGSTQKVSHRAGPLSTAWGSGWTCSGPLHWNGPEDPRADGACRFPGLCLPELPPHLVRLIEGRLGDVQSCGCWWALDDRPGEVWRRGASGGRDWRQARVKSNRFSLFSQAWSPEVRCPTLVLLWAKICFRPLHTSLLFFAAP